MKNNYLFRLILLLCMISCKNKETSHIFKATASRIPITDTIIPDPNIESFITPYRQLLNKDLDSTICYAPNTYSKKDGTLNTAIGNLMADIVFEQANPVFKKRTGKTIDIVLLNYGGIRAIIPQGNISSRTAYNVMPFENSIVVTALKGTTVYQLIRYLQKSKKAHPIHGLELVLHGNVLKKARVNTKEIDRNTIYYVATSDYLYNGGDNMSFFKQSDTLYTLDYKIRNAMIDYFKKTDTIAPEIDNRFIQIN